MEETKKELHMTREFDAPAALVYKAWTTPELVKKWWGPQGVIIPVCEMDVKKGGSLHIVMEAGEELGDFKGTQWPMTGEFVELDEPNKIVFTANAIDENGKEILQHRTTVTFDETDGRTKMTVHVMVTKALPGSEFAIKGMEAGWNQQLDKLVTFVEKQS